MTMAQSEAQRWARKMLDLPAGDVLILDTETCGLNAEVIEVGIIDLDGNQLYNRRYKPLTAIHPEALKVHGITKEMLQDEPTFAQEYDELKSVLGCAQMVLIYNAAFDNRCLLETCRLHGQPSLVFRSGCIMNYYAMFVGQKQQRGNYKWQPLTGGDHTAVGDCRAALAFLKRMASIEQVVQDGHAPT